MGTASSRRFRLLASVLVLSLLAVFTVLVVGYGRRLSTQIREKMIAREADVLSPVAQQQIEAAMALGGTGPNEEMLLRALLPDTRREGLLAMAIFDADGTTLRYVPSTLLLVELPLEDFSRLQNGRPIARFLPAFPLQTLSPASSSSARAPVLEVVLPLRLPGQPRPTNGSEPLALIGFVRYHLDAAALATELAVLDGSVARSMRLTLVAGIAAMAVILGGGLWALARAQRTITDRNVQLVRANFELTLAAKASALGQITSHLLHGIQGPLAGLRAAMSEARSPADQETWRTAAGYADRLQSLVGETVEMLNDDSTHTTYELTGHELAEIIRRRNAPPAEKRGVHIEVRGGFDGTLDSRRGGLVCLIVANLIGNAVEATPAGAKIIVELRNGRDQATVLVQDEGTGIPAVIQAHLFEPGRTGRPGGTGLGLAISRLLAQQVGGSLSLVSTGVSGTTFSLRFAVEHER